MIRTRFAPSPTGPLHLGHAYSALTAFGLAEVGGGEMLLRIEDLDAARCKPAWEAGIFDDLRWLGVAWPDPVMRQSTRGADYAAALTRLAAMGLTYGCRCTRGDIRAAGGAPQEGAEAGPIYPGTCRGLGLDGPVIRLDLGAALARAGAFGWTETGTHPGPRTHDPDTMCHTIGDVVLSRQDGAAAYHLAVVVDDAAQDITTVVRGEDLSTATALHVLLQRRLGFPTPTYHHHRLIRDEAGRRLAKRDDARALQHFRSAGATPADIRRMVGL